MWNKTILVTVADDRSGRKNGVYGKTQDYIESLFKAHPEFGVTDFLMWKWEDIKNSSYYDEYKDRLDIIDPETNGRLYKPLAIKDALTKIEDNDFLIYNDTSPELWNGIEFITWSRYNSNVLKDLCIGNGGILTSLGEFDHDGIQCRQIGWPAPYNYDAIGHHTHETFTNKSCMSIMDPDEKYLYYLQHASGFIVLQKNEKSLKFIDDWIYYNAMPECCESKDAINGEPHRTDQSISGILINKLENNLIRCLLGREQYTVINPYNLLSFSQIGTNYYFVNSRQLKQNKRIYQDPNKRESDKYKGTFVIDNWCVENR